MRCWWLINLPHHWLSIISKEQKKHHSTSFAQQNSCFEIDVTCFHRAQRISYRSYILLPRKQTSTIKRHSRPRSNLSNTFTDWIQIYSSTTQHLVYSLICKHFLIVSKFCQTKVNSSSSQKMHASQQHWIAGTQIPGQRTEFNKRRFHISTLSCENPSRITKNTCGKLRS